jgi:hypothetical protein
MTPVEIDTELARLWTEEQQLDRRLHRLQAQLADIRNGRRYAGATEGSTEEAIRNLAFELEGIKTQARPFEREFMSRPWNRYFLVTNGNGHVHRGTNCSTCFPTTEYSWLIDLADCDEDAMVEEWGERACTVCFPSAPTNPNYNRPARIDREAREARQAEAAKRQADKAAKGIVDVDLKPLKDASGYVVKTKVAARNALSDAIQSLAWYGPGHPTDFAGGARRLIAALILNAPEIDVDKVIANALKKVKDATYAGQVLTLLAGEAPAETIEDGLDIRLQAALETIAKVEVKDIVLHGRNYGQSLTVTFGGGARDAALDVLGLADLETDPGTQVLLQELARRLFSQAR